MNYRLICYWLDTGEITEQYFMDQDDLDMVLIYIYRASENGLRISLLAQVYDEVSHSTSIFDYIGNDCDRMANRPWTR